MDPILDRLRPRHLWQHFDEIRKIPHASGNEAAIREYILAAARAKGHATKVDERGNLLVEVPATEHHENAQTVALQSHLDMVCEKNEEVRFDFATDPIVLQRDGEWLTAVGTTLGADNGIGVAAALALADDDQLAHGPLTLLFTVEEEVGLFGANALSPDFFRGDLLINLDSEEFGVATIGCAGGGDVTGRIPISSKPVDQGLQGYEVRVGGLLGGHSGIDIHRNRGNAIRILSDPLSRLLDSGVFFELCDITGGNQRNAIPREARAVLALAPEDGYRLEKALELTEEDTKSIIGRSDPDLVLSLRPVEKPERALVERDTLVRLLHCIPSGVLAMSQEIPGLVETSNNMGVVRTDGDQVRIICAPRSSLAEAFDFTARSLCSLFRLAGGEPVIENSYPGWRPDPDNPLVTLSKLVHQELFGRSLEVEACHAGLECGIIGEKVPGMKMISIGPTIVAPHSPDERVLVSSVWDFWRFLTALLQRLA